MFAALRQLVIGALEDEKQDSRAQYMLHAADNVQQPDQPVQIPASVLPSSDSPTLSTTAAPPNETTDSVGRSYTVQPSSSVESVDTSNASWILQLRIRECFIYPIDPTVHVNLTELFAESFPLDKPIVTGELRVYEWDKWLYIRLIDSKGEIFADSIWLNCATVNQPTPLSYYIQPVKDSSRYFALRVGEAGPKPKRMAHILIGFRERTSAFDFVAIIDDHIKRTQRLERTKESDTQSELEAEERLQRAHVDMSLKGTIHVKLQLKQNFSSEQGESSLDNQHSAISIIHSDNGILLAPPPPAELVVEHEQPLEHKKQKKSRKVKTVKSHANVDSQHIEEAVEDQDDWGEFSGA